jgi:hypothetical protein
MVCRNNFRRIVEYPLAVAMKKYLPLTTCVRKTASYSRSGYAYVYELCVRSKKFPIRINFKRL